VIANAGDYNIVDNSTVLHWTLGEPLTSTLIAGASQVSQGFHQQYFDNVSISPLFAGSYDLKAFPNPATDQVYLQIKRNDRRPLRARLIDLHGRVLQETSTREASDLLHFDLRRIAVGTYFLQVTTQQGDWIQSFQLNKLH
jgi:hypothetical protein